MVAAVFNARCADGDSIQFNIAQEIVNTVEGRYTIPLRRFVGTLAQDIAHCDKVTESIGLIDRGMGVANVSHADDSYF
jgi:hypothetical protein